jgi:hypothetical protein
MEIVRWIIRVALSCALIIIAFVVTVPIGAIAWVLGLLSTLKLLDQSLQWWRTGSWPQYPLSAILQSQDIMVPHSDWIILQKIANFVLSIDAAVIGLPMALCAYAFVTQVLAWMADLTKALTPKAGAVAPAQPPLHEYIPAPLLLRLDATVAAGDLQEANAAHTRGDYATALRLLRPLAEQGHASAQTNLGIMYVNGRGVPQNYAEAASWFRKAADQGHDKAQHNLGVLYDFAQGAPQNYAEAARWYRLAADQGNAGSQYNLGILYANGQGVPQDYVIAHMLLNLSAAQGYEGAAKGRDSVAKNMVREQIAEAQTRAREWMDARKGAPRPAGSNLGRGL